MAQGWHGNPEGHRKAGRLGGLRSAEARRRKAQFQEKIQRENKLANPANSNKDSKKSSSKTA